LTKSDREIMGILEAFDLTRCAHSAARLVGVDEKTVARYVAIRDSGADPLAPTRRPRSIDAFRGKIEELVARSDGRIRADVVHQRLVAMGFTGSDRGTRRAVAEAKAAWQAGHRLLARPWAAEPGMWLQFGWSEGPRVSGRRTQLFCGWLPWSRYRLIVPTWDRTRAELRSAMDTTLRGLGGAPAYLVGNDARMLTIDPATGASIVHPELLAIGRYYGCQVAGCQPFTSVGTGGGEHAVKIARDDLAPTTTNLLAGYDSFVELARACALWCEQNNGRQLRKTGTTPVARLAVERQHLHALPAEPRDASTGSRDRVAAGAGTRQRS
jgi:transposase